MIHIFIINTIVADVSFGEKLRKHLEKRGDIKYFTFATNHAGMEIEITERMIRFFDGERIRFYCCGGSGTMRNIMQGTKAYKDVEFAFCPLGKTNDFLKVFGDEASAFKEIDNLIDGHCERIDYIRTNYGCALNAVSFGIDTVLSDTLDRVKEYEIFGKKVPFFLAYARAMLTTKPRQVLYKIDGESASANISEVIVGNGCVIGGRLRFANNVSYNDGKMDYVFTSDKDNIGLMKILSHMMKNELSTVKDDIVAGTCSEFSLQSADGRNMSLNLDGEIVHGGSEWTIEVVKQGMNFVMPKGIKG